MTTETIRHSNRTVLDLKKVTYAAFFWRAGEYERALKPKKHTVHGDVIDDDGIAHYHNSYPHETLLERARRLEILDVWIPVCKLVTTNGHTLEYTGKKAQSIWREWCSRVFKKQEKGK